jgi:hypothetical protein
MLQGPLKINRFRSLPVAERKNSVAIGSNCFHTPIRVRHFDLRLRKLRIFPWKSSERTADKAICGVGKVLL